MTDNRIIWTIGHSTRSFDEFAEMLKVFQIHHVVDIRSFPGSKRFPQFNKELLAAALLMLNIKYAHMETLGGRRNPRPDSINTAWRVKAFRGYADYMETEEFKNAITQLENLASTERCVIMCSEAVWWTCHRSLISDYLKAKSWQVLHIMTRDKVQEHPYTKAANLEDGILTYGSSGRLF